MSKKNLKNFKALCYSGYLKYFIFTLRWCYFYINMLFIIYVKEEFEEF